MFIGHCLLGYSEKEVGRMTLRRLIKLYGHYKNNYDFQLSKRTYHELEEELDHDGEFIRD